jgi:PKD repeat protein
VYKVTLIATNGTCSDTVSKSIDLSAINADFSINDPLCESKVIGFTNTSLPVPVSSVWKFSDGVTVNGLNSTRNFANSGTYQVKLINTYSSCKDSVERSITINKSPVAKFKPSNLGNCKPGLAVSFENLSSGADRYEWNFGDGSSSLVSTGGNVSHTFNSNGSFMVTLTAINKEGCKSQFTYDKPIVIAPPSVKLKNIPESGCLPLSVSPAFDIESLTSIADYEWNFGDGTVLKGIAPLHVYNKSGAYTITLTVTTADGCTSSASHLIEVGSKPVLSFTATPRNTCAIDSVLFTNTSQPASANYTWLFGDGGSSSQYSPKYEYNDTGWFQVKLVVNNDGCIDTLSSEKQYIYIKAPIARFMAKPNCAISYQYQFEDRSLFDKGSEGRRTWKWEFPDGTVANTQTPPVYTFPGPGLYPITLTISNGNCVHKTKQIVKIEDKRPDFTFNSNNTCKPVAFTFKAITPVTQSVVSYKWEFNGFDTVTPSRN